MTLAQRIADIEHEMSITQKNKATMSHICMMKARLAKLKREVIDQATKAGSCSCPNFSWWWRWRRLRC
jgi:ribosome-interacting GTPase 1